MLLFWGTLEPVAELSAVRFASPVRVQSIRIFPAGSTPFTNEPSIISRTDPKSFLLDIYFNAQPVNEEGGPRRKGTNALVPTSIAYPGGFMDFEVDMGSKFSTRLMILKGNFRAMSVALYGEVVIPISPPLTSYSPKPLPDLESPDLPPELDPCLSSNPTSIAKSLLALDTSTPDVELITRLMFSLKPLDEDWDHPDFPHLFADLNFLNGSCSPHAIIKILSRPLSEDTSEDSLRDFIVQMVNCVNEEDTLEDRAYVVAQFLAQSASQSYRLVEALMDLFPLSAIFTTNRLDDATLRLLLDASANPIIARALLAKEETEGTFRHIANEYISGPTPLLAQKLVRRLQGWALITAALSLANTEVDFLAASQALFDLTVEEGSFGAWLIAMLSHPGLSDILPPSEFCLDFSKLSTGTNGLRFPTNHDDFVAFVRAFLTIGSVIAVYAWSDSLPIVNVRERALAMLELWQNLPCYQQIVNHLLLLRQMTYRLECMFPEEGCEPLKASLYAERLLYTVSQHPRAILRPHLVNVISSIRRPLTTITDTQLADLYDLAKLADGGLPSALEFVISKGDLSPAKPTHLRAALAMISDELSRDRGLFNGAEFQREQGSTLYDLYRSLINHLSSCISFLQQILTFSVPPSVSFPHILNATSACYEALTLLHHLPPQTMPMRLIHDLATTISDLFVCTKITASILPRGEAIVISRSLLQKCTCTLASLVQIHDASQSTHVLNALLLHTLQPGKQSIALHVTWLFQLFVQVLPSAPSPLDSNFRIWLRQVLSKLSEPLQIFRGMLDPDHKAQLIWRLASLDGGTVGIGETLLQNDLEEASAYLAQVDRSVMESETRFTCQLLVASRIQLLEILLSMSVESRSWCMETIFRMEELQSYLSACLINALDLDVVYDGRQTITHFYAHRNRLGIKLQDATLGMLFCSGHVFLSEVNQMLGELSSPSSIDILGYAGYLLQDTVKSTDNGQLALPQARQGVLIMLERMVSFITNLDTIKLRGLDSASWQKILEWMSSVLSTEGGSRLETIKHKFAIATTHSNVIVSKFSVKNPTLPIRKWEELLEGPQPTPSTPRMKPFTHSAEMLGFMTVSPPNALLRSPEIKGLTKSYSNNDFRQMRQLTSARQNTSRLPSMHVDEFEVETQSPTAATHHKLGEPLSLPPKPAVTMVGSSRHITGPVWKPPAM